MKPVFIRPATVDDALSVAGRLRPAEVEAIMSFSGKTVADALAEAIEQAGTVYAAGIKQPEVLFGLTPMPGYVHTACAWSVNTPTIYEHPVEFVTYSRHTWDEFHAQYRTLTNLIDARNTRLHQWLRWLGATIDPELHYPGLGIVPHVRYMSTRQCA